MPCTVVNSQAQTQARLPSLPSSMPGVPQGAWTSFLQTLNAWAQILQQESHAPNVLPAQFQTFAANAATPVLAAFTAANCTPSIDATTQYYGGASLKVAIAASGAALSFTGTPISIAAASRWFAAFSVLATGGCTGSLTVKTATTTLTESFDVPAATGWQQVWGLFDLRAIGDTQATWELTFTSTATVWLDGLQMNLVGSPISKLPKFAGTQMVTGGLAYADAVDLATSQVLNKTAINITYTGGATVQSLQPAQAGADVTGQNTAADTSKVNGVASSSISPIANLMPAEAGADVTGTHTANDTANVNAVPAATISTGAGRANAAIDSTNVVVATGIDLSRSYTNKTLTNIPDGAGRYAVTNIGGGNAVSYVDGNNRALIDFSQGGHLNQSLEYMPDYAAGNRYAVSYIDANRRALIDLSQPGHLNVNADYIPAGKTYRISTYYNSPENIIENPTFQNGTAGWEVFTSLNTAATLPNGQTGTCIQGTSSSYGGGVRSKRFDLTPGATYLYSGWFYAQNGTWELYWGDYTDGTLAGLTANSAWQYFSASYTVPSSGTQAAELLGRLVVLNAASTAENGQLWGCSVVKVRDLDSEVSDGTTYGRFPIAHFDGLGTRRIATINGAVSPLGSIVTGSSTITLSYTSTSSSITISWTAGTINRMDGSQTTVSSGSVTVTGLSASTTYYAAAYWDEVAQTVNFVTGQSGAVGSPAILYASESAAVAWQAQLQARLNLGWVPVVTAASGGTGGGNGSSGCCLRGPQLIELASGVMREAQELTTGDVLSSPDGPIRITQLRFEPWSEWYRVEFNDGRILEVAPDHRFMDPSGVQIHARDLRLQTIVQARNCYLSVARLELCTDRDIKVGIEVEEPHVYYVDGVLSHNKVYC